MPSTQQTKGKFPFHINTTLGPTDWPGPKLIGQVSTGFVAVQVSVEVTVPFDGSAAITIGDTFAQANLVTISDVFLDSVGTYSKEMNFPYAALTAVNIYMTGLPSVGAAVVWIYYL